MPPTTGVVMVVAHDLRAATTRFRAPQSRPQRSGLLHHDDEPLHRSVSCSAALTSRCSPSRDDPANAFSGVISSHSYQVLQPRKTAKNPKRYGNPRSLSAPGKAYSIDISFACDLLQIMNAVSVSDALIDPGSTRKAAREHTKQTKADTIGIFIGRTPRLKSKH